LVFILSDNLNSAFASYSNSPFLCLALHAAINRFTNANETSRR
jgi:hypothetical protein